MSDVSVSRWLIKSIGYPRSLQYFSNPADSFELLKPLCSTALYLKTSEKLIDTYGLLLSISRLYQIRNWLRVAALGLHLLQSSVTCRCHIEGHLALTELISRTVLITLQAGTLPILNETEMQSQYLLLLVSQIMRVGNFAWLSAHRWHETSLPAVHAQLSLLLLMLHHLPQLRLVYEIVWLHL